MGIWQLNRRLLYFKVWGREFPLPAQIIEMPIFLEYGVFKMLCYYKLIIKNSSKMSWDVLMLIIGRTSPSPYTFLFKDLFFFSVDVVCRSLQAALARAGRVTLNWSGKKKERAQILPSFLPCVLQLLSIISPETASRNWAVVFLPLHIFTWCLVMSRAVPRASSCTEHLALGHIYQGQQAQEAF